MEDIKKAKENIIKKTIDFTYDGKRFYGDIENLKDDTGTVKTKKALASMAELSARKDIRKATALSNEEISVNDTVSFIEKRREKNFYNPESIFTGKEGEAKDSFYDIDARKLLFTDSDEALKAKEPLDNEKNAILKSRFLSLKDKVSTESKFLSDKEFLSGEGKFISENINKEDVLLEVLDAKAPFREDLSEPAKIKITAKSDESIYEKELDNSTTPKTDDFGGKFLFDNAPKDNEERRIKDSIKPGKEKKSANEKAASLKKKAAAKTALAKSARLSAAISKDMQGDNTESSAVFDMAKHEAIRGAGILGRKAAKRIGVAIGEGFKKIGLVVLKVMAPILPVVLVIITLLILILGMAGIFIQRISDRDEGIIDDIYYESDGSNVSYSFLTEDEINEALINAEAEGADSIILSVLHYSLSHVGDAYNQDMRFSDGVYDCSSYVYRAYKELDIDISYFGATTAAEECRGLENNGKAVEPGSDGVTRLKPGDLIFYSYDINGRHKDITHVAIYVGGGMMCDARGVRYGVVYRTLATRNIVSICRPTATL